MLWQPRWTIASWAVLSTDRRFRDLIITLYLALARTHLEHCLQFQVLHKKCSVNKMRATKSVGGQETMNLS